MIKKETEYGRYTTNDLWQFHSFDDEPAIFVADHIMKNWDEYEPINWYRAWYHNWKIHRDNLPAIIRNTGEEYFYNNWELLSSKE
jgi:hypothetical protein